MALKTQVEHIEATEGQQMEGCLVELLAALEELRSKGASVADSWLDQCTETVWADAGLGTAPYIDRFIVDCGNSATIVYLGNGVILDGWATGPCEPVRVPRRSYIYDLVDWALGPFYEQLWEQEQ